MVVAPGGTIATWLKAGLTTSPSGCSRVMSMTQRSHKQPVPAAPHSLVMVKSDSLLRVEADPVLQPDSTTRSRPPDPLRRSGHRGSGMALHDWQIEAREYRR